MESLKKKIRKRLWYIGWMTFMVWGIWCFVMIPVVVIASFGVVNDAEIVAMGTWGVLVSVIILFTISDKQILLMDFKSAWLGEDKKNK